MVVVAVLTAKGVCRGFAQPRAVLACTCAPCARSARRSGKKQARSCGAPPQSASQRVQRGWGVCGQQIHCLLRGVHGGEGGHLRRACRTAPQSAAADRTLLCSRKTHHHPVRPRTHRCARGMSSIVRCACSGGSALRPSQRPHARARRACRPIFVSENRPGLPFSLFLARILPLREIPLLSLPFLVLGVRLRPRWRAGETTSMLGALRTWAAMILRGTHARA